MAGIPFVHEMDAAYGELREVAPGIRRIVARNPSPFTFHGTGTYVIGRNEVAVIDPGPADPAHIEALAAGLAGERVAQILVTHTHRDHSPGAAPLQQRTGAPILGFGPHAEGRAEVGGDVEEGADRAFVPDERLRDGDTVAGPGWTLEAFHTPGHTSNHLCFRLREQRALFSGDHVMGWSTTVVSPPDGDMRAYMDSLRRCLAADDAVYWPTHGPPIEAPGPFVAACLRHREDREAQITAALADGLETIPALVERMYRDVPRGLHPAAARSVLAHLLDLIDRGVVVGEGADALATRYRIAR